MTVLGGRVFSVVLATLGSRGGLTLQEEGQVDDVSEVVVTIDGRVPEQAVKVVLDTLNDDVRVDGQDGHEGRVNVAEQHVHRVQDLDHKAEIGIIKCFLPGRKIAHVYR